MSESSKQVSVYLIEYMRDQLLMDEQRKLTMLGFEEEKEGMNLMARLNF